VSELHDLMFESRWVVLAMLIPTYVLVIWGAAHQVRLMKKDFLTYFRDTTLARTIHESPR
jgi:hypothetical protein